MNIHHAAERADHACKLDQQAVARRVGDAAVIFGNLEVDPLATAGTKGFERAVFILADEAAVARDIGRDDRRQSPRDAYIRRPPPPAATGSLAHPQGRPSIGDRFRSLNPP